MSFLDDKGASQKIVDELMNQSDRGCGIIGAAITEDILTDYLKKRLIGGSTMMERLFSYEKNGPLSHLSAKIDMAFAIGLISSEFREDLHAIRSIRNRFAHSLAPLDFSETKILAWCMSLKTLLPNTATSKSKTPKTRFVACVATITLILSSMSRLVTRAEPVIPDKQDELLKALDRAIAQHEASLGKS